MTNAVFVLSVLDAFENMKDSKALSPDDKKLVARELLSVIPEDIMAPACRNTSNAVRTVIREYLGVASASPKESQKESAPSAEISSAESPQEGQVHAVVGRPRVESKANSVSKGPRTKSR